MNKKVFLNGLKKHSPAILLAVGCIGIVGTAVHAVFDKERFDNLIDEELERKAEELKEDAENFPDGEESAEVEPELKKTETLKIFGKAFWRTILVAAFSITCLVASNRIAAGQLATVTACLAAQKADYKDFVTAAKEKLGPKKSEELEAELIQKKMEKTGAPNEQTVIVAGGGDVLFYDSWNGRYFFADMESVRKGVNDAVSELRQTTMLSGNEFWGFISSALGETENGDILGWDSGLDGTNDIEVEYYSTIVQDGQYKGKPAIGMKFKTGCEPTVNLHGRC